MAGFGWPPRSKRTDEYHAWVEAYAKRTISRWSLAAPPPERVPVESLSEEELIERAIEERRERARAERMTVKPANPAQPWTDYAVSSAISGKTYRVAVRGREPGDSYCSCPDFRTNTLGTCKHILHVLAKLNRRFNAA